MFGKDKKQNKEQEEAKVKEELSLRKRIKEEVEINVMPKSANKVEKNGSNSKNLAVLFIAIGIILIAIMAWGFYYIIFSPSKAPDGGQPVSQSPKTVPSRSEQSSSQETEEKNDNFLSIETETVVEDLNEDIVESPDFIVATSSPEAEEMEFDSDEDGLSNKEESLIGSDPFQIDSDGDGYGDLSEFLNLYDPVGTGRLLENDNFSSFSSKKMGYSFIYPNAWALNLIGEAEDSVIIKADDRHFIRLVVVPNPNIKSIEDWYSEQFKGATINTNQKIMNEKWQGVYSEDGLILYFTPTEREYIFILSYTPDGDSLDYSNLFKMVIESFDI